MRIIGRSGDWLLVLTKGIGANGEPIPKKLTPEQMREARAVTISRTTGEVSEELWLQLWLKWEVFEPYDGQPGELEAALARAKEYEEWKRQQRARAQNKE